MSHSYTRTDGTAVTSLTTAETAKLIRPLLREKFPGVKFSVRSSVYAGGSSIDVSWTDGPLEETVRPLLEQFAGATFDGMIDLKEYKGPRLIDGVLVDMGADYVFGHRRVSPEFITSLIPAFEAEYGEPYDPDKTYTSRETHWWGSPEKGQTLLARMARGRAA